ncbi:MAG: SDR family NAD(P)-dependent oxidoreductase, partial [Gammaproteobacteria bacterium]
MNKKPVCLVLGAGAGIGGHVGMKFASEGYHAVLARRSDEAGLNKLVSQIEQAGGSATGRLINAVEDDSIENLVTDIEKNIGPIQTVLFNLGAQIGNRPLEETSLKAFTLGWKMATFALF